MIRNEMPPSWTQATVKSVAQIIRGVSYDKREVSETSGKGLVPILRATNIQDNGLVLDQDLVYVPEKFVSNEQRLQPGDIIVATSSGSKHLVGKTAQLKAKWNGSFGAFCAVVRPANQINSRYLGYFFDAPAYKAFISSKAIGVNINNLRRGDLEEIQIPIAPEEQQEKIVTEIEKQFSRLDEAGASLKRVKANLKRYTTAVLKAAVEGKLTEEWRKAHADAEPASKLLERILCERRAKWKGKGEYAEPLEPDLSSLQSPPKGWKWVSIDQITENSDGKRVPIKSADRDKRSGPYPYYGASGVIDDIDDYLFDGEYLLIAEDGANLLSRSTPIAFKAAGKFWVNNHAHVVQTLGGIPLEYLATYLNGQDLKFHITGSAQPKLTQAALNKIPVLLAPLAEQTAIVAEVDRRLSVIEELEGTVEADLTRADRLRQSILQRAFSGQLRSWI